MPEYREVRARMDFLRLCKTPSVAAEVTVTAAERLGVDAAIIFADILLIIEPMGLNLEFSKGEGPLIHNPVRTVGDVERLQEVDVSALDFVFEAIRETRRALRADLPLIGFAGAPFTLASYIIEGGASKNYVHAKRLMYNDSGAWHAMMSLISRGLIRYLNAQIDAGRPSRAAVRFVGWLFESRRLPAICIAPHAHCHIRHQRRNPGSAFRHRHSCVAGVDARSRRRCDWN